MFCKECGHRFLAELEEEICPICNVRKGKGQNFCPFCGEQMEEGQVICHDCGLNINGEISQMGDGTIDTGLSFYQIKSRPVALCILLSIVTCGIYIYYWMICISEEYAMISGEPKEALVKELLLLIITCNLYGIYWAYKQAKRYEIALAKAGKEPKERVVAVTTACAVLGPLFSLSVLQYHMNRF